jgi:hypothetical protein
MSRADPRAAGELEEQATIETAGRAEVDILDAGLMAQTCCPGTGLEPLLPAQRHLPLEQERQPFGMLQRLGLRLDLEIVEGLGHAVQAEAGEEVERRVDQHRRFPQWK